MFGLGMRNVIIFRNEVYVIDTCPIFCEGWETMVAHLDLEKIEECYYEWDYDPETMPSFDIENDEIKDFIYECADDMFDIFEYNWQGQHNYNTQTQAIKGHERACKNPKKWIEKYE